MIKIVPWNDRKLTKKNLAKIWNLFPNEDICMIDIPKEYNKFQWAKVVARYYILRGKDFSIEIDPIKRMRETEEFLKIGVRNFYFVWKGIEEDLFFSSLDTISYSISIVQKYPDVKIHIVYCVPYYKYNYKPDDSLVETSISFLSHSIQDFKNIDGFIRRPHPWFGKTRTKEIEKLEEGSVRFNNITVENKCGCITIESNTNIYCCPFCKRKKKKRLFGNADRDKYVIGTIDRGLFRNIHCNVCSLNTFYKTDKEVIKIGISEY